MNPIILRKSLQIIWPLIALYSLYFLLRGHNEPGGGFIGGLILALALILFSFSSAKTPMILQKTKERFSEIIAFACLGLVGVFVLPIFMDKAPLTALWSEIPLPLAGKFSSVLVFDTIVYLVVASASVFSYLQLEALGKESQS